jgi:hypothetical protein
MNGSNGASTKIWRELQQRNNNYICLTKEYYNNYKVSGKKIDNNDQI